MLLRVATGCAKELLAETGAADARDLLGFWWSSPSVNRRLWDGEAPEAFGDLWQDAGDAIDHVEGWLAETRSAKSRVDFWKRLATPAAQLSATERICLWGLGL